MKRAVLFSFLFLFPLLNFATEKPLLPRPWSQEIIYHIMVDRFAGSRGSIDPSGRKDIDYWGGTLHGIVSKLDYLSNLGITTLLLTPVTDSGSYHGYDVMDLTRVNPKFGTLTDYQTLVRECHKRNIRIVFDLVTNHASKKSHLYRHHKDWFRKPIKAQAINDPVYIDGWTQSTFYDNPDLMQENEEVYRHLLAAAKFWMGQGIDGFRMDAVTLVAPQFWKRFNADIRAGAPPGFLILGEIFSTDPVQLKAYEPYFDAVFDFGFHEILYGFNYDFPLLSVFYGRWKSDNAHVLPVRFLNNHDTGRFSTYLKNCDSQGFLSRYKMTLGLLLTSPGIPSLLYGDEIPLHNLKKSDDLFGLARSQMKFDGENAQDITSFVRALAALRKRFDFTRSQSRWISGNGMSSFMLGAYHDPASKKSVLILINNRPEPRSANVNLKAFPELASGSKWKECLTGFAHQVDKYHLTLKLEAWGLAVLESQP